MQNYFLFFLLYLNCVNSYGQINQITNFQNKAVISVNQSNTFAALGNTYYFAGDIDGISGLELWKTDGSLAGTILVKDITPGKESTEFNGFTVASNLLYFVANDGINGSELWRTDGTSNGTFLLKDISLGSGNGISISFPYLISLNDKLIFAAYDSQNGKELWMSDGTTSGTKLLKNIAAGSASSYPNNFLKWNDNIYFIAETDSFSPKELWKTDGTSIGTKSVKKLSDAGNLATVSAITSNANFIYFATRSGSNYKLWKSDGTDQGTVIIGSVDSEITRLVALDNGNVFFTVTYSDHEDDLWISNGTAEGTKVFKDFNYFFSTEPYSLIKHKDFAYCYANDSVNSILVKTDGTSLNTIARFKSTTYPGPRIIIPIDEEILITGYGSYESGFELYSTQGSLATTKLIKEINPNIGQSGNPHNFAVLENKNVIFVASPQENEFQLFMYKPIESGIFDQNGKCDFLLNTIVTNNLYLRNCISKPTQIDIYNFSGHHVFRIALIDDEIINLSSLLPSPYIIRILDDSGNTHSGKIIKY